jgi:hypothetical protein
MGSGESTLNTGRRSTWPPERPTSSRNATRREDRIVTTAFSEVESAVTNLTVHSLAEEEPPARPPVSGQTERAFSKRDEIPRDFAVKMEEVKKRPITYKFTFLGVDPDSCLVKETIPFLLDAIWRRKIKPLKHGRLAITLEGIHEAAKLRHMCRVINQLRISGLPEDEIVRLMNGTAFFKLLLRGHLMFHDDGDFTISRRDPTERSLIVQRTVRDLCDYGAYELASQFLDCDAVQNLPPKAVWFGGNHSLSKTGEKLKDRLEGLDVPVDYEEKYDRRFHPLKRLFCLALCAWGDPLQAARIVIRDLGRSTEDIRDYQWMVMDELFKLVRSEADAEVLKSELTRGIGWKGTLAERWLRSLLEFESLVESSE